MKIKTFASVYSASTFHSNKTNTDYHKIGLIIEGQAGEFFVSEKTWQEFVKQKLFNTLNVEMCPQKCEAEIEVRLTDKGARVDCTAVRDVPKA